MRVFSEGMVRWGLVVTSSLLLVAAVGCGSDDDTPGDNGNQGPNSGANGGGNGGGGGNGVGTSLELRAEEPFEVSAEEVLKRYFVANDMMNRRMNEILQFRDGDLVEMLQDELGGEGTLDCGDEGSVSLSPSSETLVSPFDDEETTLEGTTYAFDDCVLGGIDEVNAQIDYRLYGTVTVMENADELISFEFSDDFEVRRDGSIAGEDFFDRRFADLSLLYLKTSAGGRQGSLYGHWDSSGFFDVGFAESAHQFDVMGHGGEGEASLLRREVTHPGEPDSTSWSDRSFRIQIDYQDTDGDDCVAWGQFDVQSEFQELGDLGPQRVDTITSGGQSAVVRPSATDFSIPLEVEIDGEVEQFTSNDLGPLRDEVEDTCRPELVGFDL